MNLLELLLAFVLLAIAFAFSLPSQNQSLFIAQRTLLHQLQNAQILALTDERHFTHTAQLDSVSVRYPSINVRKLIAHSKNALWQVQLHTGKMYATSSFSLYIDTPRDSLSTDFDSRPMAGDIIAMDGARQCISGYNNTNTSFDCKNNLSIHARLGENLGLESMEIFSPSGCGERESGRVYFDHLGFVYCAKVPLELQGAHGVRGAYEVRLSKKGVSKSVCVLPQGKILGSLNGC
ncbi:hypothetical protein [uncultured Helicobacter sp.]|uniref:hypothetical protein n=1 Tax=uncultured Helicobacter sp. TaxID=175537 RepID=UPI00375061C9